jgi:hypothetical protein
MPTQPVAGVFAYAATLMDVEDVTEPTDGTVYRLLPTNHAVDDADVRYEIVCSGTLTNAGSASFAWQTSPDNDTWIVGEAANNWTLTVDGTQGDAVHEADVCLYVRGSVSVADGGTLNGEILLVSTHPFTLQAVS